jgi:hypothetical protein
MPKACEDCQLKRIVNIMPYKKDDGLATGFWIEPCEGYMATVTNERLAYCIKRYHKKIRDKLTDAIEKEVK